MRRRSLAPVPRTAPEDERAPRRRDGAGPAAGPAAGSGAGHGGGFGAGPDAGVTAEVVTVEVVGSRALARLLEAAVAPGWRVVATAAPSHHPCVDLTVLVRPTPPSLAQVLARQRGVAVVAVLDPAAPIRQIVELLDAGASACVREGPVRLLVAHLEACLRRPCAAALRESPTEGADRPR